MQTAAISERIPRSDSNADTLKTSAKTIVPDEGVEPEVKRPSLGKVRLAKPKVGRTAKEQVSGEMEPALEAGNDALSSSEPSLSSGLTSGSEKQPAAPAAPVGGEVKSARIISSVPPAYPALARTQHVAGDVRIDALIDATGRVTTMKVVAGPTLLQQAAMDALRQWKYQPATLDGKAVPMHLTVTIQFRLK
jgi:protein TonB